MHFDMKSYLKSNRNHTFKIDNIPKALALDMRK